MTELGDLADRILGDVDSHPDGVKLADLQSRLRRPPQEIEATVSRLKRLGYIDQRTPGIWTRRHAGVPRQEREIDHARIRETGIVDHYEVGVPPGTPVVSPWNAPPAEDITQERTMPKGQKTCSKCDEAKGPTAFNPGSDVCRKCKAGKAPAEPKKLKAIVERHVAKPAGALGAALAELRVQRDTIDEAIAVLERLQAA